MFGDVLNQFEGFVALAAMVFIGWHGFSPRLYRDKKMGQLNQPTPHALLVTC
jgi:hypothetical protein